MAVGYPWGWVPVIGRAGDGLCSRRLRFGVGCTGVRGLLVLPTLLTGAGRAAAQPPTSPGAGASEVSWARACGHAPAKWESSALATALGGSLLLSCARLHLPKHDGSLVGGDRDAWLGVKGSPARRG